MSGLLLVWAMRDLQAVIIFCMTCRRKCTAHNMGFTLMELLVVIAIIGILGTVILAALGEARAKARDSRRLADLREVEKAIELYYHDNGQYPSTSSGWWGTCPSYGSHTTSGVNGWVPDLAPTHIPVLPTDPKPVGNNGCYLYRSNGTDYMLIAYLTVETHPTVATNPEPRPLQDGSAATCGSDGGYRSNFVRYSSGGQCW